MKKRLLIFAVLICLLISGCSKAKQTEQTETQKVQTEVQMPAQQDAEADKQEKSETEPLALSTNTEVVTEEKAPKVFWTMDITYHVENCKTLADAESQEVPWSLVKEIGLRQCPECNPPRYEGYVAAE